MLGRHEQRHGAVPSGGAPHRRAMGPEPADPDRYPRSLNRRRQQGDVLDPEVATFVCDGLARPVPAEKVQALVQELGEQPRVGGLAEAAVLVLDRAAQPGAEDHPPAAQVVQGRHLARELLGPSPGDRRHQGAQPESLGREGRGGQQHPRVSEAPLQVLVVDDVVPNEQPVPPGGLGRRGDLGDRLRVGEVAEVRDVDRESHPPTPYGCPSRPPPRVHPDLGRRLARRNNPSAKVPLCRSLSRPWPVRTAGARRAGRPG